MIIGATQASEQSEQRRYVLCDTFAGGCGKGFTVSLAEFHSGNEFVCDDCKNKHSALALLRTQLKAAQKFGHTRPAQDCELCAIQNRIDDVMGYDWREDRDRLIEQVMKPMERGGGGEQV